MFALTGRNSFFFNREHQEPLQNFKNQIYPHVNHSSILLVTQSLSHFLKLKNKIACFLSPCLMKDVQATGEAFSPQKRTSSTSKHEISNRQNQLRSRIHANTDPQQSTLLSMMVNNQECFSDPRSVPSTSGAQKSRILLETQHSFQQSANIVGQTCYRSIWIPDPHWTFLWLM